MSADKKNQEMNIQSQKGPKTSDKETEVKLNPIERESEELEIREMREDKKSISEWLGEEDQEIMEEIDSKQEVNFESKEIGFFTSRKRERDPDSITTRSNRQERPKSRDMFQIQYSSEPKGRNLDYNRIKQRMNEEGLLFEKVRKNSKYPLTSNGDNFMMGLDNSSMLDLENLISSKVKKITHETLVREMTRMKAAISEILENSLKSTFEIPIEIPITHTYPQQTHLKNNILRDLKIELNFFKEKMKKDLTKSMETRVRYIDLASSNRYDVFNDKIKRLEEKVTVLKNEIRDLKTKESSDVYGLGWNVSCIGNSFVTPSSQRNTFNEGDKENNIRFANLDFDNFEKQKKKKISSKSFVEYGSDQERKFEKAIQMKGQHSKSVNNLFKSPKVINNGISFTKFLAEKHKKNSNENLRSKSHEKFKQEISKLVNKNPVFPNLNKLKYEAKPAKVNFFNFYEEVSEQDVTLQPEISPRMITPPRPTVNSSYEGSECMGLSVIKEEEEALNSGVSSKEPSTKNSKLVINNPKVNIKKKFYCDEKTQSKYSSNESSDLRERRKSILRKENQEIEIKYTPDIREKISKYSPSPIPTKKVSKRINFEPGNTILTLDSGSPPVSKTDDSMRYTGPEFIPTDIDTDFTKQIMKTSSSRKVSRDLGSFFKPGT